MRFLISLIVVIFLTPLLIHYVGETDFGLWNLVISVLGFFELLDLGFGNAVIKYVALYRGMNSPDRRNRALSTIAYVLLMMGAIGALLIALISTVFTDWLDIPPDLQNKTLALLWIIGLRSIILGIPLGLYKGILFGEQKIFIMHAISAFYQILYGVGVVLFLKADYGIVTVGWLTLIAFLLESLTYAVFAYHYWADLKISWRLVNWNEFKEIAKFSGAQFLAGFTSLVVLRSDPFIVKLFFPLAMVGIYAIALRIFAYAFILIKQFLSVLTPYIAAAKGSGETSKIHYVFVHVPKYAMFPCSVLAVAGSCFAYPLITLWVGEAYAPAAPVLVILLFAFFLNVPMVVASDILAMTGLHALMARYNTIGALVNISFSFLLAAPLGINGIAMGTVIGTLTGFFTGIRKVCQLYHVSYWRYCVSVYFPGVVAGGIQWLVSYWITSSISINSIWILIVAATPGVLVNATIYWFFLESEEKEWIIHKIHQWYARLTHERLL